jgi:hypothetical protein
MKKLILFVFALVFFACHDSDTDSAPPPPVEFVGAWQVVESYMGIGPPGEWQDVNDGAVYIFNADLTFSVSYGSECSGTYRFENDTLTLYYPCNNTTPEVKYSAVIQPDNLLRLAPINPMCIEGCGRRLRKIGDL